MAAKYFVIEKQEEWREDLRRVKDAGRLTGMINDLSGEKHKYIISDNRVAFDIVNSHKEVIATFDIAKNINGKWKILSI